LRGGCKLFVPFSFTARYRCGSVGKPESIMKPKPTRSAAPRLLANGKPDQSNVICSEAQSRQITEAIGRIGLGLAAFARR
jgi:hypothetical protein